MTSHPLLPPIIDSHCHIDDASFDNDRDAVIRRARTSGIIAQIAPSVCLTRFETVRSICQQHADIYPAYGFHPLFFAQHESSHLDQLPAWLEGSDAVALGECGLDNHIATTDKKTQQQLFKAQLSIACDVKLPLIVHANKAVEEVVNCIRGFSTATGVVHSFNGSLQQAEVLINLGWKLGLGGAITHPQATRLRKLVQQLPLGSLLLETDAPYQSGAEHRGQRNEPAGVTSVLSTLAELLELPPADVAEATTTNAQNLFRLATSKVDDQG